MSDSTIGAASADQQLLAVLDWYRAAGVDCAVGEAPVDWLGTPGRAPGAGFAWPERAASVASSATGPSRRQDDHNPPPRPGPSGPGGTGAPSLRSEPQSSTARSAPARPAPAPYREPAIRPPPARFATGAPDAAETTARTLAKAASNLTELEQALKGFDGCALKATATSTCVYRGAGKARVMIIGEAPGRDEDIEGRPFVGRAGKLLDQMLAAIDLGEDTVHITNVVYWRPPGNRTPTPQETQICRPFLERQVELVGPEIILLLGGAAAKTVLDIEEGIMRLRGKWRELEFGAVKVRALPTLHPAYLLRTPAAKRHVWRDLIAVRSILSKK